MICQIFQGKIENSNSEDFYVEFVDRDNFLTKNWRILVQPAGKNSDIFSQEILIQPHFHKSEEFSETKNLVKIQRDFLKNLLIGPSPGN